MTKVEKINEVLTVVIAAGAFINFLLYTESGDLAAALGWFSVAAMSGFDYIAMRHISKKKQHSQQPKITFDGVIISILNSKDISRKTKEEIVRYNMLPSVTYDNSALRINIRDFVDQP